MCYDEVQSNFIIVQLSSDRNRYLKRKATPNHGRVSLHRTSVFAEIWSGKVSSIFTLQILDSADSHWNNIADFFRNYYNLTEFSNKSNTACMTDPILLQCRAGHAA